MHRVPPAAVILLSALLGSAALAGIAIAAEGAFDVAGMVEPSAPAGLLPPITIEGRKGWACTAERNATATTLPNADLPTGR